MNQGFGNVQKRHPVLTEHPRTCVGSQAEKDGAAVIGPDPVTQCGSLGKAARGTNLQNPHGNFGDGVGFLVGFDGVSGVGNVGLGCNGKLLVVIERLESGAAVPGLATGGAAMASSDTGEERCLLAKTQM